MVLPANLCDAPPVKSEYVVGLRLTICRFENGQIIFFFTIDALEESLNLLESGDHENLDDNPEGKKSFKS